MLQKVPSEGSYIITEKAPTRAFSWLKAATTAFTSKILRLNSVKIIISELRGGRAMLTKPWGVLIVSQM